MTPSRRVQARRASPTPHDDGGRQVYPAILGLLPGWIARTNEESAQVYRNQRHCRQELRPLEQVRSPNRPTRPTRPRQLRSRQIMRRSWPNIVQGHSAGRMRACRLLRWALLGLGSSRRSCATATGCCCVTDLHSAAGTPTCGTYPVDMWNLESFPALRLLGSCTRSSGSTSQCLPARPCSRSMPARSTCRSG